ncbi:hypothetical protein G5C51_35720 [Streptomyces sp. A7024]|uniref:Uncharacterized protein n=1 Tax=Streptomyces coryli TaxID=1128680 RepID=A0A6G4UB39_9ACTN|nr:hypothetical protein [Streptomyces coryli]NGN69222.1 hypothetical protein [Streptomyces coryli]
MEETEALASIGCQAADMLAEALRDAGIVVGTRVTTGPVCEDGSPTVVLVADVAARLANWIGERR